MHNHAGRLEKNNNAIPCIGLSAILFLILGILPILPTQITQVLRPAEIALCFVFPAAFYLFMISRPWSKKNIQMLLLIAAISSAVFAAIIFRDNPDFLHEILLLCLGARRDRSASEWKANGTGNRAAG